MNEKLNVNNVVNRMLEPTPHFWKKVRKAGLAIGLLAGAVLAIPVTAGIALPSAVIAAAQVASIVGGTTVGLASLTSSERK